jgi:hypothetical protein
MPALTRRCRPFEARLRERWNVRLVDRQKVLAGDPVGVSKDGRYSIPSNAPP